MAQVIDTDNSGEGPRYIDSALDMESARKIGLIHDTIERAQLYIDANTFTLGKAESRDGGVFFTVTLPKTAEGIVERVEVKQVGTKREMIGEKETTSLILIGEVSETTSPNSDVRVACIVSANMDIRKADIIFCTEEELAQSIDGAMLENIFSE
jgi:hypothetical protein